MKMINKSNFCLGHINPTDHLDCIKCKNMRKKYTEDNKWELVFDRRFTAVVSYTKWPDEGEAQKLPNDEYVWNETARVNPKLVKYFISDLLIDEKQKMVTEIQRLFIQEFCNNHMGGIRWLRNVAIDEEDLLKQILELFSRCRENVAKVEQSE